MKVIFLDRDGVINKEVNYLHQIDDFEYTNNCIKALKKIRFLGFEIIVITNQAGIAKGIFSEESYHRLTNHYIEDLSLNGIDILDVYFCPHHKDATVNKYKIDCKNRKPNPGMILDAIKKYSIDKENSYLVGDKMSDIEAGLSAGIESVLVESGHIFDENISADIKKYKDLYDFSNTLF